MGKKISSKILLTSFVVIICLSKVLWLWVEKYVDATNYENRELAARPELTMDNYETYPDEYEKYFNDRIPFRNHLISLNSAIDYYIFDKTSNSRVVKGNNSWLFYNDPNDGDSIGCYTGENIFSDEVLREIADNCVRMKSYLNERGIEFVIFIAPNKERIYYEEMPERYGFPAETYRALQVVTYLRDNTDIRVVYPYEELMDAKSKLSQNIYYKTDTHWNMIGGYVGASSLLKELGIDMPSIYDDSIEIVKKEETSGDLAGMLNLNNALRKEDYEYSVKGYNEHDIQVVENDFFNVFSYTAEGADERKIYVRRDSFSTAMAPYIGSQFNNSYLRLGRTYSYNDFIQQQPDIFVYETVERYVDELIEFSIEQ